MQWNVQWLCVSSGKYHVIFVFCGGTRVRAFAHQAPSLHRSLVFVPLKPHTTIMNSVRVARVALRARPVALKTLQKRGYADAVSDKIKLSLALPHQVCRCARAWRIHSAATRTMVLTAFAGNLPIEGCRSGQYPSRVRRDGRSRKPRSIDRATKARSC